MDMEAVVGMRMLLEKVGGMASSANDVIVDYVCGLPAAPAHNQR